MPLNTSTNLVFDIIANTANCSISVASKNVEQKYESLTKKTLSASFKRTLTALGYSSSVADDGIVTKTNASVISSPSVLNSSTSFEQTTINVSAIVSYNVRTCVCSLTVTSDAGKRIDRPVRIFPVGNMLNTGLENIVVELDQTSTTKSGNNITARVYDVFVTTPFATSSSNVLQYNLSIPTETLVTRSLQIKDVIFKGLLQNISPGGEERLIKIYGNPGTNFKKTILNSSDISIISTQVNSMDYSQQSQPITMNINSGASVNAIEGKIPKNGVFNYKQKFPRAPIVLSTKINVGGGVTNATQVTFDSLVGVSVGDQLFSNFVKPNKAVKVVSIDSEFVCTLSRPITASDDADVTFRTSTSYKFIITSTDSLSSNIPSLYPNYTLNQYLNPVLTIKATTATTNFSINGAADGVDNIQYYEGRAGATNQILRNNNSTIKNEFKLLYTINGAGSKSITVNKTPVFAQDGGNSTRVSDFTNTDPSLNGGTDIDIGAIRTELSNSNTTCTITAFVTINKWGTSDVIMELNLDNILTAS